MNDKDREFSEYIDRAAVRLIRFSAMHAPLFCIVSEAKLILEKASVLHAAEQKAFNKKKRAFKRRIKNRSKPCDHE